MTCPNATAPVDIVNNPDLVCDLKCEYSFKYPQSSLNITNRGEYLSLKTDQSNIPPVTYNADKYEVAEIRLYHPSLHSYSGKKAEAELIIMHNGVSSSGNLLVCVPIVTGGGGDSADIFDTIISEVAKTATSPGKKTTVNIPTFSIDKFIPLKPYFSYSGTLPYSPCNGDYDYIVFSKNIGPLGMTELALESLKKLTTANGSSTSKNKQGVFYNKKGPSALTGGGKDDFYMVCDPTGSEGEKQVVVEKTTSSKFNTETITQLLKNSIVIQILIGAALIIALTKIGSFLLNKITKESAQAGGGVGMKLFKSACRKR